MAAALQLVIEPGEGRPIEQLSNSLDAYLVWIEANERTWSKLVQSAASLSEAGELTEGFTQHTMDRALAGGRPRDHARPQPLRYGNGPHHPGGGERWPPARPGSTRDTSPQAQPT
jgi:hypothetical protein